VASTPDNQAKTTTTKKAPAKATKTPAKATSKARAKTTAKAPAKPRGGPGRPAPSHNEIARRAHELYEAEGGGDHLAHWLQAERDLSSN
jgi:hypothetical protein